MASKRIGITGGIGSGKTTVTKIFSTLGVPIYYADDRSKWLLANDLTIREKITAHFGFESFKNNLPDHKFIASQTFHNPEKLQILNNILHPEVKNDFEKWFKKQTFFYILKEAALLFEADSYKDLDQIITVAAPESLRIARVKMRDPHRTEELIVEIVKRQLPEEFKISKSDFVIYNDGVQSIVEQVLKIHRNILAL